MIASDIHGSEYYCRKMLECYDKEGATRLVLLGDLLYHGPRNDLPKEYHPKAVIALLNERKDQILCVRGNCEAEVDQMVLEFPVMADYAIFFHGTRMIFATHGHLFHENKLPPLKHGDILLHGHTHILAAEQRENYIYLNPGSVSIPKNGNVPTYMIYENNCFIIKDFDGNIIKQLQLDETIDAMISCNLNSVSLENKTIVLEEDIHSKDTASAFLQFCEIVRRLRAEDGCPWDRAQTHESLETCMIEEAYEVVEAIQNFSKTNDYVNLREELGDVLLQVVLHGQIASEEGIFELKDIIDEISQKMIRRHPHVFGRKKINHSNQVPNNWEEIKKQEKKQKGLDKQNELESIPKAFPALIRAQKVLKKSGISKTSSTEEILKTIQEKFKKLELFDSESQDSDTTQIIGSLYMDLTNLAMHYGINSEKAVAESVQKLIDKYQKN